MIRVTIELVPGGFDEMRQTIAAMEISNVGDGHYRVVTSNVSDNKMFFHLVHHNREQSIFVLLYKALRKLTSVFPDWTTRPVCGTPGLKNLK